MMTKGYRFSLQVLHAGDGYLVGWGLMHWFLTLPDVAYYAIGEETLLPMYTALRNLFGARVLLRYQAFKLLLSVSYRYSRSGCE